MQAAVFCCALLILHRRSHRCALTTVQCLPSQSPRAILAVMERRLLRLLGIFGLVLAGFLFVVRIRKEPPPPGIYALGWMRAEDPTNTRLAKVTDENVATWNDLRDQRDRAELTAIVILSLFSVATLVLALRLPRPATRIRTPNADAPSSLPAERP